MNPVNLDTRAALRTAIRRLCAAADRTAETHVTVERRDLEILMLSVVASGRFARGAPAPDYTFHPGQK